jgi:hypothetical protein
MCLFVFFETWEMHQQNKHTTSGEATGHGKSILPFSTEEAMKISANIAADCSQVHGPLLKTKGSSHNANICSYKISDFLPRSQIPTAMGMSFVVLWAVMA